MAKKPTYEELQQKVKGLEKEVVERRRLEELSVSALSWDTTFDAITESVCLIDVEGKILQCNKATVNFLGKPINEIVGNTCWKLVHGTSEPIKGCPIVRMRETLRPESLELAVGDRVLYIATHPILDQNGNLASAVHIITDITERKRAEDMLRESEATAKAILNTPTDAMALIDTNGIILDVNETMARSLGRNVNELIGLFGWDLLPPELTQSRKAAVDKVIQSGKPIRFEDERQGIYYDNVFYPVFDAQGETTKVAVMARDITERKRAEEALQRAHDELEKRIEERTSELSRVNEKLKNKTINLEEVNAALKVLLKRRDEDRIELEEKVLSNVKGLIFPYIENLKMSRLDDRQMGLLGIIESNLNEIITPFLRKLSSKYSNLTPKEIQVAGFVKEGKTSKEIAELLDSSENAVEFHRRNLRKKLGISNTKTNLNSYLLSLP